MNRAKLSMVLIGLTALVSCQNFRIHSAAIPQIHCAAFSGNNTAWLVTYGGTLMITHDGGTKWDTIPRDAVDGFEVLSFVDAWVGWTVNRKGLVWRTNDAGQTWLPISTVGNPQRPFTGAVQMTFLNESEGWIIETFTVWHTRNGGLNWEQSLPAPEAATDGKNRLLTASQPTRGFFLDAKLAWIAGVSGEVYYTEDGGRNWTTSRVAIDDTALQDVFFVDGITGWVVGSPMKASYRTDDGGKHWRKQFMGLSEGNAGLSAIYFNNRFEGWAVGQVWPNNGSRGTIGILLHTIDGGERWQRVELGASEPFFDRVYFVDSLHGWLFGRDNVYRTEDGGKTWRLVLALPPSQ